MLRVLINKEMRGLLGSTKFALTFGVCTVLIVLSFYIGAANYKVSVAHYEASKSENLRQLEGVTDWLMVRSSRIFLPPQPLAALVTGISNDIGRTTEVEARGELAAHDSRFNEEPIFAVFRFLDLNFIFTIVLSLFAILLGHDAISGEKESGTLKLALANAVPRSTYILGKLIGSFLALSVSLLVALSIGCLLLPMMGVPMASGDWARLGMVILTGLLYFGVFLSVSVFVSTMTQRTSSSFLLLLVVWIVSVLIIPRASVLLAGRAVTVPSVDETGAKKASYASQLWSDFRNGMKSFKSPETEDVEQIMNAFNKYMDSLTAVRDEQMNSFAAQLNEERYNRQLTQQAAAFTLARLSPVASLSLATAELAGTSLSLKNRYYQDAMEYQKTYAAFLKEKTGMNVGGRMMVFKVKSGDEEEEEPVDSTELPAYVYNAPSLSLSVQAAAVDMGLLGLFSLFFFAAAFVAFGRYDAR
jgi:ABC-type transport system involved in multi-copper enzyme maturation permease subunit